MKPRRVAATMFAAAALLATGAAQAFAFSPNPGSCADESRSGYLVCRVLGPGGPADTVLSTTDRIVTDAVTGLLGPGIDPIA